MTKEIGIGIAYSLFSSRDWKLHDSKLKKHETEQTADHRQFFVSSEGTFYMMFYKNGDFVEFVPFTSTKAKMKPFLKGEFISYE